MTYGRSPRRQFKVCLIGEGFVGKTSIRRKYLGEGFKRSYLPTLGVDFAHTTFTYDDVPTTLVIWDIAGQTQFQSLRRRYYDGCSGIILVYSVMDRLSFENATKWLVEAHDYMQRLPPLIIAANKIDLRTGGQSEDIVSTEEGRVFTVNVSEKLNTPAIFIETSALTGDNINEAFFRLTELMLEKVGYRRPVEEEPVRAEAGAVATSASTMAVQREAEVSPTVEIDPVTALPKDSPHLQEERIGEEMVKLKNLRAELKKVEDDLAQVTTDMETSLLNLRNLIHVKRIMYEHLKKQILETRQEWADAYDEYQKKEQAMKDEVEARTKEIEHIRRNIENIGKTIRKRVGDLDFKKISER